MCRSPRRGGLIGARVCCWPAGQWEPSGACTSRSPDCQRRCQRFCDACAANRPSCSTPSAPCYSGAEPISNMPRNRVIPPLCAWMRCRPGVAAHVHRQRGVGGVRPGAGQRAGGPRGARPIPLRVPGGQSFVLSPFSDRLTFNPIPLCQHSVLVGPVVLGLYRFVFQVGALSRIVSMLHDNLQPGTPGTPGSWALLAVGQLAAGEMLHSMLGGVLRRLGRCATVLSLPFAATGAGAASGACSSVPDQRSVAKQLQAVRALRVLLLARSLHARF
jgi:hypothetical protein